ncbi:MAG: TetR/AcrR family transcriptional regulator [Deltaproteobacteria bacterium]|nr:TetR/AcrR family transcriptional regulator [Deltaproteobacteria bacterium]MCW5807016.1 TetR/AcrR family transcriptional regulator [Deltaproteobacteria bacterium]
MNLDSPRRRRRLRTQVREQVRAAILDAAEELIADRGLEGTALAQIAAKAGVAVGTLYNYFDDRDAMVRALFATRRATFRPQLLAVIAAGKGLRFEARLRRFMRELFEVFEANRRYIKVAFAAEHLKQQQGAPQDLRLAIEEIVAAGVAEGVIAKASAQLLATMLRGAIRAVVVQRIEAGGAFPDDADGVVSLVLDGARRRG